MTDPERPGVGGDPGHSVPDAWSKDRATRWSRGVLRGAARLVPAAHRGEWLEEWEAELWQLRAEAGSTARLFAFLTGSVWHAAWERKEGWTMDSVFYDVRQALRTLRRNPGFAVAAILLLGTGIGTSTALFSVIEAAVFAVPPYPEPDRLVVVDFLVGRPGLEMRPSTWSYPRFMAYREAVSTVDATAGYTARTATLTELGDAAVVNMEVVTPQYFSILGVDAVRGRTFGDSEEDTGAPILVAMISNAFWRTRMGSAPDVVGKTVTLNRNRLQVVGVLPPAFEGLTGAADLWIPLSALRVLENDAYLDNPWNQYFQVIGRLAPGASLERASLEARAFGATVMDRFPPPTAVSQLSLSADVAPFLEARVNGNARASMFALFGAVSLMLLAVTANLAALLLARGAGRAHEAALRASLGAGRARLARQMLTEAMLTAVAGGLLGIALAYAGLDALSTWLAQAVGDTGGRGLQYLEPARVSLNWRVLGFAGLVTGGVGVLFGLFPAWQIGKADPGTVLKGGRGTIGSRSGFAALPARSGLIVVQIGLTLVLLTGATLMLRSVASLQSTDLGYDLDDMLGATYTLTQGDLNAGIDPTNFHFEFLNKVRSLPGVVSAALGEVPMGGPAGFALAIGSEGRPDLVPEMHLALRVPRVSDGYLRTLGARLVDGRGILATDTEDTEPVIVLNQSAAAELFPDGEAIGRRLQLPWPRFEGDGARVVGVIEDLRYDTPRGPPELQGFVPLRQAPPQLATGLLVRVQGNPVAWMPGVRSALADLDDSIVLSSLTSIDDRLADVIARPRVLFILLSLFAALALTLVAAGLYGIIAYTVASRTRELGLRASIGADPRALLGLILIHGLVVTGIGIACGALGVFWLTPFLGSLLFDVQPLDPLAVGVASSVLFVVATLAAYLPARRATRIDPMSALRAD